MKAQGADHFTSPDLFRKARSCVEPRDSGTGVLLPMWDDSWGSGWYIEDGERRRQGLRCAEASTAPRSVRRVPAADHFNTPTNK